MRILHIIVYEEKFTPHLVAKLNENFKNKNVFYCLVDKKGRSEFPESIKAKNVMIYQGLKDFLKLFKEARAARVIIYNALFYRFFLQMQLLLVGVFKPKVWVVWSGDMYLRDCSSFLKRLYNRFLISRFSFVATPIEGDFDNYKKIWGFKAKNLRFWFPFSSDVLGLKIPAKNNDCTTILVGNSGHFTNRHLEVADMLEKYKNENIKIIIPLSYGCDNVYREKVESYYHKIFSSKKVRILKNDLPFVEYVKLLGQVDIGIFNHFVQEAGHNVMLLETLGKKVYISKQNTLLNMSKAVFKVNVFEAEQIPNLSFSEFIKWDKKDSDENKEKMRYFASDEFFIDEQNKFFNALEAELI